MADLYLGCLIGGLLFALVSIVFSTIGGHGHDLDHSGPDHGLHLDFLKPVVIVSAIAGFGGAGLMLHRLASLPLLLESLLASVAGLAIALGVWLLAVRPMRRAEQSVGYTMAELRGKVAEVVTTVPERGYGEVIVKIGGGFTSRPALSADGEPLPPGTRVVIVEVSGGEVRVVRFD